MSTDKHHLTGYLTELLNRGTVEHLLQRLEQKPGEGKRRVPAGSHITPDTLKRRWDRIEATPGIRKILFPSSPLFEASHYERNIENFIGTVTMPLGLAGPLRVNGLFAQGEYYLPLASTEAALVASYHRGACLLTQAGGCTSVLVAEGLTRAPGFAFSNLRDSGQFVAWVIEHFTDITQTAESTTRHGKLTDLKVNFEGNHVYLLFEYQTGDASGQNMVTIATDAACSWIMEHTPVKPDYFFVEANMSGDKKASAQSFLGVRGKKVTAEALIPADLVEKTLHTTARRMTDYWRMSAVGGVLSGTIGVQGHYANGLTALYIACGQDAACISESSVGVTRFEVRDDGSLYAAVTLPNLMVGTVGGGTGLPTQRACLELMGLYGPGKARALAEVCAGLVLAGELSIIGALAAGEFSGAHQRLARGKQKPDQGGEHA